MASFIGSTGLNYLWSKIKAALNTKQDTLVSGTNIKTVCNQSLVGSGDVSLASDDIEYIPEASSSQLKYIGTVAVGSVTDALEALDAAALPVPTTANNGKILKIVSGQWESADMVTVYSGSSAPASSLGSNGDIYVKTS